MAQEDLDKFYLLIKAITERFPESLGREFLGDLRTIGVNVLNAVLLLKNLPHNNSDGEIANVARASAKNFTDKWFK